MQLGRILKILLLTLCLCFATATGIFLYNAYHSYNINYGFTSLPLKFNPDDSSSSYNWRDADITVYNGFIKGIQRDGEEGGSLIIRALSPFPAMYLNASNVPVKNMAITIENLSPVLYAKSIEKGLNPVRTALNTLKFIVSLKAGEKKSIKPVKPDNMQNSSYVILGDNRDGYETFSQIIDQVNAWDPPFVIDNGDLVYSGKPNQYRLFDRTVSKLSTTLCSTLGNHDIRGNGRETYTKLYGPKYYSFDLGSSHFAFLDSSPGWSQKQAISDEQYAWLERDLKKAQDKRIYVITHVPPEDPRSGTKPNEIPYFMDKVKQGNSFFELKLEEYSKNESMNHGFQDKQETVRFENLMVQYKVDTVYLSHIHSYYDYIKNGVRYIISGGAGAELLTKNSYYHYLIAKTGTRDSVTMVQLPSPPNLLLKRYTATVSLFAEALYDENKAAVIFFIIGFVLLVFLLLLLLFIKLESRLSLLWILIKDTGKYISDRFKVLFKGKS
jgi:3',5'-cyclic-AMP phosphodiesterase